MGVLLSCLDWCSSRVERVASTKPGPMIIGGPTNVEHLLHVDDSDVAATLAGGDGLRGIVAPEDLIKWRDQVKATGHKVKFELGGSETDSESNYSN